MRGFFAYPASPNDIGQTIESAIKLNNSDLEIKSWKALDIIGHFISQEVTKEIEQSDFIVADISVLNFNVTYEVGYAIGKNKKVILIRNKSIRENSPTIREVGIYDTVGYLEYQNSNDLIEIIKTLDNKKSLRIPSRLNPKSPVYLLECLHRTDWATRIVSRIKKLDFYIEHLTLMNNLD